MKMPITYYEHMIVMNPCNKVSYLENFEGCGRQLSVDVVSEEHDAAEVYLSG